MPEIIHLIPWRWRERSFLTHSAVVLAEAFPNPNREGCPDDSVLRRIKAGVMPLAEAAPFLEHLGRCSDCFRSFRELKRETQQQKRFKAVYGFAGVVLIVILGTWWRNAGHAQNDSLQAVVDLRPYFPSRGINVSAPEAAPAEFSRSASEITLLLPLGAEGHYAVEARNPGGALIAASEASGVIQDSVVRLTFKIDLRSAPPGALDLWLRPQAGQPLSYRVWLK